MASALRSLGHYIEPELYLPLALPHLRRPGLDHSGLARLIAAITTMLGGSWATETAARAAGDDRVGGLAAVQPSTLAEFLAEVAQPAHCASASLPLRLALARLLQQLCAKPDLGDAALARKLPDSRARHLPGQKQARNLPGAGDVCLAWAMLLPLARLRALAAPDGELGGACDMALSGSAQRRAARPGRAGRL
jgi:hypothetical protein